jgi:hypothetical protein
MARADGNKRSPSEYQNLMTPRWLTALFIGIVAGLIYVVVQHASAGGWLDGFADVLAFGGGMLASGGISSLAKYPSAGTYIHVALKALTNRESDFRRAGDPTRAELASHFRWLLSSLTGLA